ncbi:hypothetical protein NFI96_031978 [Prochilodus magdalenae]|nr:hypothetical protein NFI96_031978 [Prochilodus magdalenae]
MLKLNLSNCFPGEDELRIVLLGKTGAGKSSAGNTLLGEKVFKTKCSPKSETQICERREKVINGRRFVVIDTPGFFDTHSSEEDIRREIISCLVECAPGPHVFILVLEVGRYTRENQEAVGKLLEHFRGDVVHHMVLLFTRGDDLEENMTIQDFIDQSDVQRKLSTELTLKDLAEKCGNRVHVIDNKLWNKDSDVSAALANPQRLNIPQQSLNNIIEEMQAKQTNAVPVLNILSDWDDNVEAEWQVESEEQIREYRTNRFQLTQLMKSINQILTEKNNKPYKNEALEEIGEAIKEEVNNIELEMKDKGEVTVDMIKTRKRAKDRVRTKIEKKLAGVATGILLGALLGVGVGVAAPVALVAGAIRAGWRRLTHQRPQAEGAPVEKADVGAGAVAGAGVVAGVGAEIGLSVAEAATLGAGAATGIGAAVGAGLLFLYGAGKGAVSGYKVAKTADNPNQAAKNVAHDLVEKAEDILKLCWNVGAWVNAKGTRILPGEGPLRTGHLIHKQHLAPSTGDRRQDSRKLFPIGITWGKVKVIDSISGALLLLHEFLASKFLELTGMMASTMDMPEPICIINNSEDGKLCINEEAVQILDKIIQPVVVVAVAGLYRTGKSYLLNRLARKDRKHNGFALGATMRPKTKGIWMWCVPHPRNNNHTLVLLDTKGLGGVKKEAEKHDVWIFTLAALLSSTLVYNSKGAIDTEALEKLHHLAAKLNPGAGAALHSQPAEFIHPSLVWTVRDFTQQLESEGNQITDDDYLEEALTLKKGNTDDIKKHNLARSNLQDLFAMRKCFVFERPVLDPDKRDRLENLEDKDLNPHFVEKANDFCEYIFTESKTQHDWSTPQVLRMGSVPVNPSDSVHALLNSFSSEMVTVMDEITPGNEVRIVVLGKTGVGKSAAGNTLLGEEVFKAACQQNSKTQICKRHEKETNGRKIVVIDTPGIFDTHRSKEDLKKEIISCLVECAPGPHVFILVLAVERYTKENQKAVEKLLKYFTDEALSHTLVLFTRGYDLDKNMTIQDFINEIDVQGKKSGKLTLKGLSEKCGNRVHVIDNKHWNSSHQSLNNISEEMRENQTDEMPWWNILSDPDDIIPAECQLENDEQIKEYRSNRFQLTQLMKSVNQILKEKNREPYKNKTLEEIGEAIKKEVNKIKQEMEDKGEIRDITEADMVEIRRRAKERVRTKIVRKLAGVAVGTLLGALLGAEVGVAAPVFLIAGLIRAGWRKLTHRRSQGEGAPVEETHVGVGAAAGAGVVAGVGAEIGLSVATSAAFVAGAATGIGAAVGEKNEENKPSDLSFSSV